MFAAGIQAAVTGKPNALLSAPLAKAMVTEQVPNSGWGLGVVLSGQGQGACFSHSGQNKGYLNQLTATISAGPVIVIMTASDEGAQVIHPLLPHIRKLLSWPDQAAWVPVGQPGAPAPSFSNQQALDWMYAGDYLLDGTGSQDRLSLHGSGLNWTLTLPGGDLQPIEPITPTFASSPGLLIDVEFNLDKNGRAIGLTIDQDGKRATATRT